MGIKFNGAVALSVAIVAAAGLGYWVWQKDAPHSAPVSAPAPEPSSDTSVPVYRPPSADGSIAAASPTAAAPAAKDAALHSNDPMVIKRVLPIKGPIKYGEWHWDDANVPDGEIIISVDLTARVMSVFKGGYEIGAAAVLLGTPDHPTPTGTFPIKAKYREHYSSTYDGAPMPFTQRLTNDGIALHATTVERIYASHGCVGMPDGFARKVFEATRIGDRVIITRS